jgi:hypothetical protein
LRDGERNVSEGKRSGVNPVSRRKDSEEERTVNGDEQKSCASWFRPRGRLSWQKLIGADGHGEALSLLLNATDSSGDLVALPRQPASRRGALPGYLGAVVG